VEFDDAKGGQEINVFLRRDRNKEETTAWRDVAAIKTTKSSSKMRDR